MAREWGQAHHNVFPLLYKLEVTGWGSITIQRAGWEGEGETLFLQLLTCRLSRNTVLLCVQPFQHDD